MNPLTHWKRAPLRRQLSLAMALVCLLALGVAGTVMLAQLHRQALSALDDTMGSLGQLLANRSSAAMAFGDAAAGAENLAALKALPYVSQACLIDALGVPLARHARAGEAVTCPDRQQPLGRLEYRQDIRIGGESVGVLWLRANDEGVLQRLRPSLAALGLGLALALGVALLAAQPLQRALQRPLDRVREVAQRVEQSGDFEVRVPDLGEHELGRLGRAFNRMLDTIARQSRALGDRERHARALFEASHLAQLVLDRIDGRILEANAAAVHLLAPGPDARPLLGRGVDEALGTDAATRALHSLQGLALGELKLLCLPARRAQETWEAELHLLCTDRDGQAIVHAVLEDVTERRALERARLEQTAELERRVEERTRHLAQTIQSLNDARDQLVLAEKQAALARLVAGMAHEINTPVGNARLAVSTIAEARTEFVQAIQAGLRRSELERFLSQVEEGHELAERNLQRVIELVAAFKQMSADQASMERRHFLLDQLVEEIMRLLAPQLRRSGCELTLQLEPGIEMFSQAGPLEQVVVNLVQNALLHGFDGRSDGRLRIEAKRLADGEQVELVVSDDGVGMRAEVLERAFDPFFTTKMGRGGLGLGLPIVQGLVQKLLGGRLQIDSAPDMGTRVSVRMPLQGPES
jgi:signal transduction histidine kinase